jgi:membrane protease YdiL (CAAX protease family)
MTPTTLVPTRGGLGGFRVVRTALLLAGFALAIGVRVVVGGAGVRDSVPGGLVFAVLLGALAAAAGGLHIAHVARGVAVGAGGAALLCLPLVVRHAIWSPALHRPGGAFLGWAWVVGAVAVAEEALLRGALFDAVEDLAGSTAAIAVGAVAFAALHVPLYGWNAVPLDLAVGVLFGCLRLATGNWLAPAVAHVGADLAGWWLR